VLERSEALLIADPVGQVANEIDPDAEQPRTQLCDRECPWFAEPGPFSPDRIKEIGIEQVPTDPQRIAPRLHSQSHGRGIVHFILRFQGRPQRPATG
jgi:hypothetical protein